MGLVALNISAAFLPFFKVFNHTRFYSVIALQRINIELRREASIATHKNDPFSCVSGPICLNFVGIKTVVEMQTTTGWKNCVVLWKVVPGTQSSRRFGVKTWLWSGKKKLFFFFFLLKMKKRTVETGQLYFGSLQYINTQLNYYYFSSLYEFFSHFLHQTKHYSPRHLSQWLNDVQGILFL